MIPVICARQYAAALPNATLEVVEEAGHLVDLEEPEALAGLVAKHAGV